jgi:hypothetical protein
VRAADAAAREQKMHERVLGFDRHVHEAMHKLHEGNERVCQRSLCCACRRPDSTACPAQVAL